MTTNIPSVEPTAFAAGDLVQFTRTWADYPSDSWTLAYRLLLPTAVDATVTTSGSGFLVAFNPADTAAIVARTTVRLVGYVTGPSDRKTVFDGYVTLTPNPAIATAANLETHETRCLALIELAIENDLPTHMKEYEIDGKRVWRLEPKELLALRDKYRTLVWRQRNPGKSFKQHAVRFTHAH